jgi:hypothetical protein
MPAAFVPSTSGVKPPLIVGGVASITGTSRSSLAEFPAASLVVKTT